MTKKTAVFCLFILFLITPLFAEEPVLTEEITAEKPAPTEELAAAGEPAAIEEIAGEEPAIIEEIAAEEPAVTEEIIAAEEPAAQAELAAAEEADAEAGEPALSEEKELAFIDDLDDVDYFFFEAPPLVIESAPFLGTRSFEDLFPNLTRAQRTAARSEKGLRFSFEKVGSPMLVPNPASGIDLLKSVMAKRPSHIVEALVLVPYSGRELDMLDVYNALGRIGNLKDHSVPLNGRNFTVFPETTRLESARNRRDIPDPLPANDLPFSETMFLRFKDATIGDIFIRGDMSISMYGLTYSMTNFRDVRYSIIPIMRAERVSIIIYVEPVKEGMLIYSLSGFYLPGIIANSANLSPSIDRRISVLLNWIKDGLIKQASVAAER
ncbi:MAG: hypothetical protein FWD26_04095 [Treponema sp.]|nr:hypothetical protein [Treponema sp.]